MDAQTILKGYQKATGVSTASSSSSTSNSQLKGKASTILQGYQKAITAKPKTTTIGNVTIKLVEPSKAKKTVEEYKTVKKGLIAEAKPTPKAKPVQIKPDQKKIPKSSLEQIKASFSAGVEQAKGNIKNTAALLVSRLGEESSKNEAEFRKKAKENPKLYDKKFFENRKKEIEGYSKKAEEIRTSAQKNFDKATEIKSKNIKVDNRKFLDKARDPQWIANSVAETLPNLITSIGVSATTLAVTKNPAVAFATGFASTFSQEAGAAYQDAKNFGADKKTAEKVAVQVGMGAGLLEMLPIAKLLDRSGGGTVKKKIIRDMTKKILVQASLESGTESLQEIVANVVAKTYDENRDFFAGVPESALIGGLLGSGSEVGGIAYDLSKKGEVEPQVVIDTVMKSGQEKTPEGKALIKTALEAQDSGQNMLLESTQITTVKDIEQNLPQIDKAKDYVSASDFATAVYDASPDQQIGFMNPNDIIARDPVDRDSIKYKKLKKDYEQNGQQEPIDIESEGGSFITLEGSHRLEIAKDLGRKVAVIVRSGKIEGFQTIEELYNKTNRDINKKAQEKIESIQTDIQQAQMENEAKKSILDQFSSKEIQAMRTIKRAISVRESRGEDPTSVNTLPVYKDHIEDVMSAINTTSEDEALAYIMNELPDKLNRVTTREELRQIKVLKTHVKPKEVTVPREQLPVGEGKEKVSRLEARMKGILKEASQEQIDELGLTTFNQMNQNDQITLASQYVVNNQADALKVLKGEMEAPKGILRNSIYVAMDTLASGDTNLAQKLATLSSTRFGQELNILKKLNKDSPVAYMAEVVRVREADFKRKHKGKSVKEVKEKMIKEVREKVKKVDKYDWNNFIDSIDTC